MLQKDGKLWTGCFNLVKQPLAIQTIFKIAREFKEAWYLPSGGGGAAVFFPDLSWHIHTLTPSR